MKMKILNATLIAIGIFAFATFIHSCKKTDNTVNQVTQDDGTGTVKKAIIEKYGNLSASIVYPVNTIADQLIVNQDGSETVLRKIRNNNARIQACSSYDCVTAENNGLDPSGFEQNYTLSYAEVYAGCGTANGTKVTVTWDLSVPYTVLSTSGTFTSKGRIRFVTSTGTVLYSTINITPIAITSLGIDPNCSNNKLFRVTYSLANVQDSYLGNGNRMECGMFIYTNCSLVPSYITAWTQAIVFPVSYTYALPCSRIDKLWINNSTGTATAQCATVGGAYLTCPTPPVGFTRTTNQQVEYRKRVVASYDWNAQTPALSPVKNGQLPPLFAIPLPAPGTPAGALSPTLSASSGVLFLKDMVQGASALGWLIRYKNVYSTTCPTTTPLGATWSPGTYTTEYWPY